MCGPSRCDESRTLLPLSPLSTPMSPRSLVAPFMCCKQTTGRSSIILQSATLSPHTARFFVSLARTLRNKMAALSACFALLMTAFAPSSFTPTCHHVSGLTRSPPHHYSSTSVPIALAGILLLIIFCSARHLPTSSFAFSIACATLASLPLLLISSHHGPWPVFFLAIPPTPKATAAMILSHIGSSLPDTFTLIRWFFRFSRYLRMLRPCPLLVTAARALLSGRLLALRVPPVPRVEFLPDRFP